MNIEKSVEEKENILNKLVQENDLQKGSFISYDKRDANVKCTFMELYNQYKGSFTKYEFANLLGIKNENLRNLRRNTKNQTVPKARVLMNQCATDDEKYEFYKQRIKKDIIDKYKGKKIDYEMLVNQILEDVQEKKELGYSKKEIIQELIMEYDITPEIMKKLIEREECEKKNGEDERC